MKKIHTSYFIAVIYAIIYCSPAFSAFSLPSAERIIESKDSVIINQKTIDGITLKNAMMEFKSLSKHERKLRIKEAKIALKDYKAKEASGTEASTNTILLVILAILLPPLAVYLHENEINGRFWLSVLLTLLFWIPGVIYALIIILG